MYLLKIEIPGETSNQEVFLNPDNIVFISKVVPKKGDTVYGVVATGGVALTVTEATFHKIQDFAESVLPKVPDAFHSAWASSDDDDD